MIMKNQFHCDNFIFFYVAFIFIASFFNILCQFFFVFYFLTLYLFVQFCFFSYDVLSHVKSNLFI